MTKLVVNVHEAKTHLSRLIEQALAGEEVVIARAGKPAVTLKPVPEEKKTRPRGLLQGQIWTAPDVWDDDPEIEALFGGSESYDP
jgi:prevent-host-death family protein